MRLVHDQRERSESAARERCGHRMPSLRPRVTKEHKVRHTQKRKQPEYTM